MFDTDNLFNNDPENMELDELEALVKAEEAKKGLDDLYFFDKYILGYKDMEPKTHLPICHALDDRTRRKKHIEYPRGNFKSSVATIGYTVREVAKDPNIRILIDNEVYGNSKSFLREIKAHLENPVIQELYPQVIPNKRVNDGFTESSVIVQGRTKHRKEPTISCAGLDQIKIGMHYDLIIMDDLVSTRNVTTKEQIEKVIEHYKMALSLLDPGGMIILIGTRYHYSDLYGYVLENEAETFDHLIIPAKLDDETASMLNNRFPEIVGRYGLYKSGDLLFPERITEDFLKEQRQAQGTYIFNCQYMLNPVNTEEADFHKEWLKYYRGHLERLVNSKGELTDNYGLVVEWLGDHNKNQLEGYSFPFVVPVTLTATFDPNNKKKKTSDNTGMTIVGSTVDNDWYVIEMNADKFNPGQIVDEIIRVNDQYKLEVTGVEEVGKETIKHYLIEKMRKLGKFFRLKELKTGGVAKEDRIKRLIPRFEFGTIFLPCSIMKKNWEGKIIDVMDQFEDEYIYFPLAKKDDLMDALAYQQDLVPKAKKGKSKNGRRKGKATIIG